MLVETDPSHEKALKLVYNTSWRSMIILIGECSVNYIGRAKSFLDFGERLVMVKKDGSVLVHQSNLREPVNWQPPGTRPTFHSNSENFTIRAQSQNSRESMTITFNRIDLLVMKDLSDNAVLKLTGMEEDVVKHLMDDPSLIEEGLRITKKEKRTESGSIDLFCRDKTGAPVIVEVKRSMPSINAVYQLEAYVRDFKRKNPDCPVRAILVAPRIPLMVKHSLDQKGFENREITTKFKLADDQQSKLGQWF